MLRLRGDPSQRRSVHREETHWRRVTHRYSRARIAGALAIRLPRLFTQTRPLTLRSRESPVRGDQRPLRNPHPCVRNPPPSVRNSPPRVRNP
jgi:hypothetical protein